MVKRRHTLHLACIASFLAVFAAPWLAQAQGRVALVGFYGPSSGAAQAGVQRVLEEASYEVVDSQEWQAAARGFGHRGRSQSEIVEVAAELGVLATVSGGIRRARRQWRISLIVRDGATGEIIGRRGGTMPAPSRAGAAAGSIMTRLLDDLAGAQGASGGGGGSARDSDSPASDGGSADYDFSNMDTETPPGMVDESPTTSGGHQAVDDELVNHDDDDRRSRRRRRRSDRRDEEPRQDDGDDSSSPHSGGGRLENASPDGWLEIGLELNLTQRNIDVAIDPNCDGLNRRDQAVLDSGVYTEFGFRTAFYPGAMFSDRWWSGFGLELAYSHHLSLKIVNSSQSDLIEAEEQTVGLRLAYRLAMGQRPITLWFRFGWFRYSFVLGEEGNDVIPPFVYDNLELGLALHIPIHPRYFGIDFGGGYLAPLSLGDEATMTYNARDAYPSANGFNLNAGIGGAIWRGLRWRIGFELLGFYSDHQGKGRGWGETLCDTVCAEVPGCLDDAQNPIEGGIATTDTVSDVVWRLMIQISYRFAGAERSTPRRSRDDDEDEDDDEDDDEDINLDDFRDPDELESAEETTEVEENDGDEEDDEEDEEPPRRRRRERDDDDDEWDW